jgi:nickel/cobalt transporter (NiCoT) family protein
MAFGIDHRKPIVLGNAGRSVVNALKAAFIPRLFDDQPDRVKLKVAGLFTILTAANIAAWVWAWIAFEGSPLLLGMAFLAYLFGLRHAVDVDHITAIDNVVRKLSALNRKPIATGFFFSLGHSAVVILIAIAVTGATSLTKGMGGTGPR